MIGSDHDFPTTILSTHNRKVAFLAVVISCNATAGFSSAVKRVSLGTQASQRIPKGIDGIPKIDLKSVILDTSSSKSCYKIIINIIIISDNFRKN